MRELGDGRSSSSTGGDVPLARSIDIRRRLRVYVIQMGIRLVCVLLLPVVPGWWKLLPLAGAVVLPYVAVLLANDPDLRPAAAEVAGDLGEPVRRELPGRPEPVRGPRVVSVDEDGTVHVEDDGAADAALGEERGAPPGHRPDPARGRDIP